MGRVQDKVAFITGAARGQGRSHAIVLAREGASIVATDLCGNVEWTTYGESTNDDLDETARLVEAAGGRIVTAVADVRDRDALREAAKRGMETFGRLDIVVANAGVGRMNAWDTVTDEIWRQTIDINLTGVWNTVVETAPHLIASGGGSMILTSSAAGLKAQPFMAPYTASKFGVTGLAKALAQELSVHNIRVNSIHPAGVDTEMAKGESDAAVLFAKYPHLAPIFANILPVTFMSPEDVSNAVLYLASDESRYVTATSFAIDAGNSSY
jgi:SDR family mycofactocin-dependent oxidoreductase